MKSYISRAARLGLTGLAALAVTAVTVTGCASADVAVVSGEFAPVEQDSSAPLTVWVDAAREPAVQDYMSAHPDIDISLVTYDGNPNTLQAKVSLFNKAGEGWPDVVFSTGLFGLEPLTTGEQPFAAPLNDGIFPDEKIEGFAPRALDPCTVGETLYCIRNDIAQNVFWYNQKLFDEFGYEVPTTWEEYEALGEKVAAEHPGYSLGEIGDSFGAFQYFWGSRCPANQLDEGEFTADLTDEHCIKMAQLLDRMIANGTVQKSGALTGAAYVQGFADKTLAMVGPSWFGAFVFRDALKVPAGQIAAAPPLQWEGDTDTTTGNVGGGVWYISAHSENLEAASDVVEYLTTDMGVLEGASTYPAFESGAAAWLENPKNTGYYANDVSEAFRIGVDSIWDGWSQTARVDQQSIWSSTVLTSLASGKTLEETLPAWQAKARNLAGAAGYIVTE
ncbi:extracellular solute-binding protein [Microbacterium sp. BK668]|uniref:ABC transporter substrate-binding protein n=1 Tax=Microbacterium sp. BK668 TaxID=2512118 RepID=UPI00105B32A0|nr:extracellular solute-binding protein [Microbacterium sp. BK668]TDN91562.1 carbohydrate ABC transporter substrate-binding protein (CUT1 family) [Microbacterium sp. BK668]